MLVCNLCTCKYIYTYMYMYVYVHRSQQSMVLVCKTYWNLLLLEYLTQQETLRNLYECYYLTAGIINTEVLFV